MTSMMPDVYVIVRMMNEAPMTTKEVIGYVLICVAIGLCVLGTVVAIMNARLTG